MLDIKNKKAIFFDFGDTLASTEPTYPDRIRIALLDLGFKFTEDQYFSAFQYADYQIYKNYIKERRVNSKIYQKTLISTIIDQLGINIETEKAAKLIKQKMATGTGLTRMLLPGADTLLKGLSESGYKLAIISNNDGKTESKCAEVGIKKYFELIIDSTKVKKIKPDKEIFLLASKELGIETKDILHVGDLYGADILGAGNAGIDTVWVNAKNGINYDKIDVNEVINLTELSHLFELS